MLRFPQTCKIAAFLSVLIISSLATNLQAADIEWVLRGSSAIESEIEPRLNTSMVIDDELGFQPIVDLNVRLIGDEIHERIQKVWYFPTTESISQFGTETVSINEVEERLRVLNVKTILPDGRELSFSPNSAQLLDSDTTDVFTSTKQLAIPFAGLTPGSIAVLDYERIISSQELELPWGDRYYSQYYVPRGEYRLRVDWERSTDGPLFWDNDTDYLTCTEDDYSLTCIGKNIPAIEWGDDVLWQDVLGKVSVSENSTWQTIGYRIRDEFEKAVSDVGDKSLVLDDILTSGMTKDEQISEIYKFVAQDIRYLSASESGHAYRPHDFFETLENRYGDCKDKSVLLVGLLREIGVAAYPVLVNTEARTTGALGLPSVGSFDHMIVCFNSGGKEFCLDATDSYGNWKSTSLWIQGRASLPLLPGAAPSNLPVDEYPWQVDINTELKMTSDGGQIEHQSRSYQNGYGSYLRGALATMTGSERTEWLKDSYNEVVSSSAAPNFEFVGFDNISADLILDSTTSYSGITEPNIDLAYYEYDSWLIEELNSLSLSNKTYDSHFSGFRSRSIFDFDISEGWRLDGRGSKVKFDHRFGRFQRGVEELSDGVIRYTSLIEIPSQVITAEDVEEFNQLIGVMKEQMVLWVYGKPR